MNASRKGDKDIVSLLLSNNDVDINIQENVSIYALYNYTYT